MFQKFSPNGITLLLHVDQKYLNGWNFDSTGNTILLFAYDTPGYQ